MASTSSINLVEVEELRGQTVLTTCKSTYPIRLMVPKGGSNKTPVTTAEGVGAKVVKSARTLPPSPLAFSLKPRPRWRPPSLSHHLHDTCSDRPRSGAIS